MSRIFSVPRRRSNIVDLYADFVPSVTRYRVYYAANFDVAIPWTQIIECSPVGFFDDAVSRDKIETQNTSGKSVRIVFDPATFTITDASPFWLRVAHVVGAVETYLSPATLILPEAAHHGVGAVVIQGTAPAVAVGAALQIDLPRLMSDIRFVNDEGTGGTVMYVSTDNLNEVAIYPTADAGQTVLTLNGTESTLFVRGDSGTVAFSATCTLAFPK